MVKGVITTPAGQDLDYMPVLLSRLDGVLKISYMKMSFRVVTEEKQTILFIRRGIMTFDDALKELMGKSYYLPNGIGDKLGISMKDAVEIILDLRDAFEEGKLEN